MSNSVFHTSHIKVCWTMLAITVAVRIDVYGMIYALALGSLLIIPKRILPPVWLIYLIVHGALLLLQYSFLLGVPHGACYSPDSDRGITARSTIQDLPILGVQVCRDEQVYTWCVCFAVSEYPWDSIDTSYEIALFRWFYLSYYVEILDKDLLYSEFNITWPLLHICRFHCL